MSSDVRNIAKRCEINVKVETVSWAICKSVRVRLFYLHNSADTPSSSRLFHISFSDRLFYLHVNTYFTLYFNSQSYYSAYFYIMLTVHYSSNVLAVVTANLPSFSARALLPRYVTAGWTFFLPSTRKQAISVIRGQTEHISLTHDVTLTDDLQSPSCEPLYRVYSHARDQGRRSVGSKDRMETIGRTDGRTDVWRRWLYLTR